LPHFSRGDIYPCQEPRPLSFPYFRERLQRGG
jgi:hypothetical protein